MHTSFELFGIECGPGWNCLVWPLLRRCELEGVQVSQIKEKFGGLRFYVGSASESLLSAIDDAEELSFTICEACGDLGTVRSGGWLITRCDNCYEKKV